MGPYWIWLVCAVTRTMSCCWGTCLDPWSCCSWGLWWCPWCMLLQGFIGTMRFEIQGLHWAHLLLPGPGTADHAPRWSLKQESWPYPTWESQPPHSREMASWLTIDAGELTQRHGPRGAGSEPLPERGWYHWPGPTSPATTQTHILCLGLTHPNTYPIYDWQECVKALQLLLELFLRYHP